MSFSKDYIVIYSSNDPWNILYAFIFEKQWNDISLLTNVRLVAIDFLSNFDQNDVKIVYSDSSLGLSTSGMLKLLIILSIYICNS